MKKLAAVIVILSLFLNVKAQKEEKDYSEAFVIVEAWLEAQKDFGNLPGISAIVVKDQQVLWKGAFGMSNIEKKVETSPSTLYSICSISKLFTSVAVMKLYDEGKLRLDDEIHELLPWFNLEQKYPSSGPITVRSLLTHSSGLPREAFQPYWTGPDFPFPSTEEMKAKLGEQETLYPSSTYFQYSNLGLSLLGEIVKQVSGQDYDTYIQQNILNPLGLSNTRPYLPEELYGNQLAIGYSALQRDRTRYKVNFFQAKGIKAAAGFTSNVEDLGKFAMWQFRLREADEPEILKPSTLKDMQRVQYTDPNWKTTWGLGFSVTQDSEGNTVVGHGGSCPGYRTQLTMFPKDKLAFSVMINAGGENPQKYIAGIKSIMSKVKKADKDSANTDLSEYVGYYNEQPWGSEEYIGVLNGKLISMSLPTDSPGSAITFFKHVEGDTFQRIRDDEELGETIRFERDDNGKVIRYKHFENFTERIR